MKMIRVLHLASFNGNIGDNANHNGFYNTLCNISSFQFEFTELEIREFYRNQREFDRSFVDYVNQFDLLIIGGGNYFELWVEHSPTGTSVMISPDLFQTINIPVIFNALGVDPRKGASKECCKKFRHFLDIVFSHNKNLVSMRNDGSKKHLVNYIGEEYKKKFLWTPDAGINITNVNDNLVPPNDYLAVNIAGDMLDLRFPETAEQSYSNFINDIAHAITTSIEDKIVNEAILIPHIYRDVQSISELLEILPDYIRRKHIRVAPLLNGTECEKDIFGLYKHAKMTLAMRFHANICSISFGTPTIGLVSYRQISDLYDELEISQFAVDTNKQNTRQHICSLITKINNNNEIKKIFRTASEKNKNLHNVYIKNVSDFLDKQFT